MVLSELETPALIVDRAALVANIAAADRLLRGTGKRLRPHVKTHRTPAIALLQQTAEARGVTCATVGEAEAMAEAGITDILIANEIVSAAKIERVVSLATRAAMAVAGDAAEPVLALSAAAAHAGVVVSVLVDLDVGLGRCGVRSAQQALELARVVRDAPGLRFAGLMGYEGRLRHAAADRARRVTGAFASLADARRLIESAGLEVPVVSGAGTSTLLEALEETGVIEIQAGTYALMEHDLDELGLPFRCAVALRSTVISRAGSRVVVDVGRKTAGCEYALPAPTDGGVAVSVSEEHTVLEYPGAGPALGATVSLIPSNVRTTFNLHDVAWLVHGDDIVERLDVTARGRSS